MRRTPIGPFADAPSLVPGEKREIPVEVERLLKQFRGLTITEARVDSKLPDGITLSFCLSPTPVPIQWKSMFTHISNDKHGSVISITNPLLHGNDIVWKVVEGDIPNARSFVEERVDHTNAMFTQMLIDTAPQHAPELLATSDAEIARLQAILDAS